MIKVYAAEDRHRTDMGWLVSRPSFQFGAYVDPDNAGFGVLRVFNDDFVAPGKGFGAHPHSDMEIVSVILKGAIRHEDNLGNIEITRVGEVQRITAGAGVIHAEYNPSESEELNLLQMWFMPRERGLAPSYETSRYDPAKLTNALHPIVTPTGSEEAASIQQDDLPRQAGGRPGDRLPAEERAPSFPICHRGIDSSERRPPWREGFGTDHGGRRSDAVGAGSSGVCPADRSAIREG